MSNPNSLENPTIQNSAIFVANDQVDQSNCSDVYQFNVNESGIFTADLTKLTGDADVRLIQDINNNGQIDRFDGEILAWQWERGTQSESIRSFVQSGNYFVQVISFNNESANYQLIADFQQSSNDSREFDIQIQIKDDIQSKLGLTNDEFSALETAIENASQLWEAAIPYGSNEGRQTLKINLEIKDLGNDGKIASAGGDTIKYNINSDSLKGRNDFKDPTTFQNVITHEIGHLLGISDSKSPWKNHIDKSEGIYKTGTYASWAFGEMIGTFQPTAVPITSNEGNGSDYSHWDERVFSNEVMTHASAQGAYEPLSQLTIAALQDMGWNVNYGAAQLYQPTIEEATLDLLIEQVQALDEDGIGSGAPKFYAKVQIDGKKYPQTANESATSDFNPIYPNWSFSKALFYDPNLSNWIPIKIGIYDKDEGVFDGTRPDDHVDININPEERDLRLEYNLLTSVLRNRDTGLTYTPDVNGRFYSEGDNETELTLGDFDGDGNLELGPSDKVGVWFRIQTVLPPATILSDGTLKLNLKNGFDDLVVIKHISGVAGSEVVDVTVNGVTQRFGPGTLKGKFTRIEGIKVDGSDTITLDGVLTTANLDTDAGDDTVQFINSSVTNTEDSSIVGGIGSDTITGGAGSDTIHGESGNDTLAGGAGSDHIIGGDDNDQIDGGSGNDVLSGDSGNPGEDIVSGSEGDDIIGGGGNNDILNGDAGNDIIWGDSSFNIIDERTPAAPSAEGNDIIDGGSGDDEIHGEGGDDTLFGGTGNDIISGDDGNDFLDGGSGDDQMVGGVGNDVYIVDSSSDRVIETLSKDEGGGIDRVESSVDFSLVDTTVENLTLTGTDNLRGIGNELNNIVIGNSGDNSVYGSAGDDTLSGQGGDDHLLGEAGDDCLNGGSGSDILDGGEGFDKASYADATGPVLVNMTTSINAGSAGGDTFISIEGIEGSQFGDRLVGDDQDNYLSGLGGNDALDGRDGDDTLEGGEGSDRLTGGDGKDSLQGGTGDDVLNGGNQADELFGDAGDDLLEGGEGNDLLNGGAGNDIAYGAEGDDKLLGDSGDDYLEGGEGNDTLSGGDGADILDGYLGQDKLDGGAGNDILSGGGDNDTLAGNTGNDLLDGGAGNDTLTGGTGDDMLTGGGGHDLFVIQLGDGTDTITDFTGTGIGTSPTAKTLKELDVLQFSGAGLSAETMLLTQVGNDLEITFEGVTNTRVQLQGVTLESLDNLPKQSGNRVGGIGNILFDGQTTIHDDFDVFDADWEQSHLIHRNTVTFLNDLDNTVDGFNRSNDVINGQGGNDTLNGLSGDDVLRGGSGADTLIGGAGDDTLVGGAGADQFQLNAPTNGIDTIHDFSAVNGDRLLISSSEFGNALLPGILSAEVFTIGAAATRTTDRFIYNSSTGALYFDADGTGAFGQTQIAQFSSKPTLSQADILTVA